MTCVLVNGGTLDDVGLIPGMLDPDDPRPAKEQFHENYRHGGGWRPFNGKFIWNSDTLKLTYPGDPAMHPLAFMHLRDEVIMVYPSAWVLIVQPDDSYEICRMD